VTPSACRDRIVEGKLMAYKQLDLRVSKRFPFEKH
jgi:hypothetical protein